MTVEALHSLSEHFSEETIQVILSAYMQNSEDNQSYCSSYSQGLWGVGACLYAENIIPFSVIGNGEPCTFQSWHRLSGAPEMLLQENPTAVVEAHKAVDRAFSS